MQGDALPAALGVDRPSSLHPCEGVSHGMDR
jgi:hypothetical protein